MQCYTAVLVVSKYDPTWHYPKNIVPKRLKCFGRS